MNGAFFTLTEEEQENLLRAIETSLQVKRRHQFFLWSQGPLQAFIPHKSLVCVVCRDGDEALVTDCFNTCPVSETVFEEICNPINGLVTLAMSAWRKTGDSPILLVPDAPVSVDFYGAFKEQLDRYDFGYAAGHGIAPVAGCGVSSSFFFFAHMPPSLTLRHAYFIEMLMPHIHIAFLRTLAQEEQRFDRTDKKVTSYAALSKLMSEREIEVLRWVQQGKSNNEIGCILNISPLTVKNHVQKVLRKLDVRNRAQAVSKATAMRIIDYTGSPEAAQGA